MLEVSKPMFNLAGIMFGIALLLERGTRFGAALWSASETRLSQWNICSTRHINCRGVERWVSR